MEDLPVGAEVTLKVVETPRKLIVVVVSLMR